jgi:hypothetical protein
MAIQVVKGRTVLAATPHAKNLRARLMVERGKGFVAAAMLLDRKDRHYEVVLHLLCQGLEIFVKGLLLLRDYDRYSPKLTKYGHNLVRLVNVGLSEFKAQPLPKDVAKELAILSNLYSQHLLRYSSLLDVVGGLATVKIDLVTRRLSKVMKLSARRLGI